MNRCKKERRMPLFCTAIHCNGLQRTAYLVRLLFLSMSQVVAGKTSSFTIIARDTFGNPKERGGEPFEVCACFYPNAFI